MIFVLQHLWNQEINTDSTLSFLWQSFSIGSWPYPSASNSGPSSLSPNDWSYASTEPGTSSGFLGIGFHLALNQYEVIISSQ